MPHAALRITIEPIEQVCPERQIIERVLEEVSFHAPDSRDARITIDRSFVLREIGSLTKNVDLSRFIL